VARLRRVVSVLIGTLIAVLALVGVGISVLETGWAKNKIRELIVRQANGFLTATLQIGSLGGSLLRGLELTDVRLARDGRTLVAIDAITLRYSIRELLQPGVVVRQVRLIRPRVAGGKLADGRWDLATLVNRERRENERTGPGRPVEIQSIEIVDGDIALRDEVDLGAAHIPTRYAGLNASFSFAYYPVRWLLTFNRIAWVGSAPELTVNRLAGTFGHGPTGWFFQNLRVETPRSAFTLRGTINTELHPTNFDLQVTADRFAFQEWAGVLHGLQNIAIDASFETSLKGPTHALATDLRLTGSGGNVRGALTLDTTVPGWHSKGAVDVNRLDLSRWLNRRDRPSDITGHVTFDLALELGRHFPEGAYTFDGAHAMYLGYGADDLHARGSITEHEVRIADAKASAYGAAVSTNRSSIGLDEPFPFHFTGIIDKIDLRQLPRDIPVPHVESTLTFDYDVTGRFSQPVITGRATFAASEFLGAAIGPGTTGTIDTAQTPMRYTGEGDLNHLEPHQFGEGLDVAWMRDPRFAGTIDGHFHVDGSGTDRDTMTIDGGGRLTRAPFFQGVLHDADVSMTIAHGTLTATYDGAFDRIDPSIPFEDDRFAASLTGAGRVTATVRDLLTSTTTALDDYDVAGTLTLGHSRVRDFDIDRGQVIATLQSGTLTVTDLQIDAPAVDGRASGTVKFSDPSSIDLTYNTTRLDLAQLRALTDRDATGTISTNGRATGSFEDMRLVGNATANDLDAFNVQALTLTGPYDVTVGTHPKAQVTLSGSFITAAGASFAEANGTVTFDDPTLRFDVALQRSEGPSGRLAGAVALTRDRDVTAMTVSDLSIVLGSVPWRLAASDTAPTIRWTSNEVTVPPVSFIAAGGGEGHIGVSGTIQTEGAVSIRVTATHVFLETLQNALNRPARYGGVLDGDLLVGGSRANPTVAGTLAVSAGRVERVTFQQLAGRVDYANNAVRVDFRLDQSPGISVTAAGTIPRSLVDASAPDMPLDLTLRSTTIDIGLVEGLTSLVSSVTGQARFDVHMIGTGRDPHFEGSLSFSNAGFVVTSTGARYHNANAAIGLASDRVTVESLHIEDTDGHPLDVRGSLGTHELRVGELEVDATAKHFEILHDDLGRIAVDVNLQLRGRFEQPSVLGNVTIATGELRVDEVLGRTIFQPYSTQQTEIGPVDAVEALNPWDRLAFDFALHIPDSLRFTGNNVQVTTGTPVGIGDINLRVGGDLYIYKGAGGALSLTGSLDDVAGSYAFQGRRFTVDEAASSINFRGDLNPEVYVAVTREISGIQTRVSIAGPLNKPELQLTSSPPLDPTDILSLIVFNVAPNQLSAVQQQELVVRAGTLAAGFLAAPMLSAIQQEIGLQVLDIEPSADPTNAGPRVTVGQEILPGLVAQFSRQFGTDPYDEATVEYYLSRILRLRATFSDAQSMLARSPFRLVERAGVDLLFFFSF
jgi:autotransporter translocation and assembly factor TamB